MADIRFKDLDEATVVGDDYYIPSDSATDGVKKIKPVNFPVSTDTQTALDLKANSGDLATVATSGDYDDLTSKPTLGTAAATDSTDYATAAQGATADSAVQPGDLGALATEDTVTSALLDADVFSTAHSWSGVQTLTDPVVGTQTLGDNTTKAASTAFVQAAISASGGGDMLGANNLSELTDLAVARDNLGLGNSSDGWIGIDQSTPLAPLHIGAGSTNNSVNAYGLISRTETRSGVNAHGYSDSTDWNGSSSAAYCSYDARITVSGSGASDHFAAFQAAPTYGGTQTTSSNFDFYSAPTVSAGSTVTHRWGLYVGTAGGSGTIGDEVGVYVAPLERGSGTNYGLKISRTLGSGHVGQSTIDGITVGGSGGDYSSIGYNVTYTTTTGSHKYAGSDYATMIRFGSSGKIQTFTSVSGTAGNTISFTAGPEVVQAATSWSAPSDARLKQNVETLDVLSRLEKFRAVEFDWKDPERFPHDVGVIAQELVECFPEVVNEGAGDDPWSVEYDRLGAVALGGVKQLLEMVKDQARQIAELRAKIAG